MSGPLQPLANQQVKYDPPSNIPSYFFPYNFITVKDKTMHRSRTVKDQQQ